MSFLRNRLALVAVAALLSCGQPQHVQTSPTTEPPVTSTTFDTRAFEARRAWYAAELWNATETFNAAVEANRRRAERREREATTRFVASPPTVVPELPDVPTSVPCAPAGGYAMPPGAIVVDTCGWGDAANCVMNHENAARVANRYFGPGISLVYDGNHSASGLFQFVRGTWNGYGGFANAAEAPAKVQRAKFELMWDSGNGRSHWNGSGC